MDMFDLSQVISFAKAEPGHGFLQSFLLFMIWMQSKGLRRELSGLKDSFASASAMVDNRFEKIEQRITNLEGDKK